MGAPSEIPENAAQRHRHGRAWNDQPEPPEITGLAGVDRRLLLWTLAALALFWTLVALVIRWLWTR